MYNLLVSVLLVVAAGASTMQSDDLTIHAAQTDCGVAYCESGDSTTFTTPEYTTIQITSTTTSQTTVTTTVSSASSATSAPTDGYPPGTDTFTPPGTRPPLTFTPDVSSFTSVPALSTISGSIPNATPSEVGYPTDSAPVIQTVPPKSTSHTVSCSEVNLTIPAVSTVTSISSTGTFSVTLSSGCSTLTLTSSIHTASSTVLVQTTGNTPATSNSFITSTTPTRSSTRSESTVTPSSSAGYPTGSGNPSGTASSNAAAYTGLAGRNRTVPTVLALITLGVFTSAFL